MESSGGAGCDDDAPYSPMAGTRPLRMGRWRARRGTGQPLLKDVRSAEARAPEGALGGHVGLTDVVMLGAGSALGVSVFSVLGPAAKIGGSGILLTLVVAALPMCVFGLVYAFMASSVPKTGASFEWPREYIHPLAGFGVAWVRILGQVGQMATLAAVLLDYLSQVVDLPARPAMLVIFGALWLLNLRGIDVAARAQTLVMCVFLLVLGIFIVSGIPHVEMRRIGPLIPHGWLPVLLAAPIMANLFMGIEAATEIGEEVRDPTRNVPLGIAIALCSIGLIYASVCFVALGLVGPRSLALATAPLVVAAKQSLGRYAIPLVVTASTLSLLKSLNATYILFTRSLFAMGRSGLLSNRLGHVDPRRGSPRIALHVAFVCACVGVLLPNDLIFLFVASSIPTVLKYMSTSVCAVRIARGRRKELSQARFRISAPLLWSLGWLGVACAAGILALSFADDWRASALVAGWGLCGLVYWVIWGADRVRKAV